MSTTKAALRNLNDGVSKLAERTAELERHSAELVSNTEKLRESNHAIAAGVSRIEFQISELKENDAQDLRSIRELQGVVGSLSDKVGLLYAKVDEMLHRFDRVTTALSLRPEPPSSTGFATPEETTNPGFRHGER